MRLSQLGEDPHSDYINANFMPVSAHLPSPAQIRPQGTVAETLPRFRQSVPFSEADGHEMLVKAQPARSWGKVEMCSCPSAGIDGACQLANGLGLGLEV